MRGACPSTSYWKQLLTIDPLRFPPLSAQAGVAGFFIACALLPCSVITYPWDLHAAAIRVIGFVLAADDGQHSAPASALHVSTRYAWKSLSTARNGSKETNASKQGETHRIYQSDSPYRDRMYADCAQEAE